MLTAFINLFQNFLSEVSGGAINDAEAVYLGHPASTVVTTVPE